MRPHSRCPSRGHVCSSLPLTEQPGLHKPSRGGGSQVSGQGFGLGTRVQLASPGRRFGAPWRLSGSWGTAHRGSPCWAEDGCLGVFVRPLAPGSVLGPALGPPSGLRKSQEGGTLYPTGQPPLLVLTLGLLAVAICRAGDRCQLSGPPSAWVCMPAISGASRPFSHPRCWRRRRGDREQTCHSIQQPTWKKASDFQPLPLGFVTLPLAGGPRFSAL